MNADFKKLEEKISQLITLCADLRNDNARLRGDLTQSKEHMLLASSKLEDLLATLPESAEATKVQTISVEAQ